MLLLLLLLLLADDNEDVGDDKDENDKTFLSEEEEEERVIIMLVVGFLIAVMVGKLVSMMRVLWVFLVITNRQWQRRDSTTTFGCRIAECLGGVGYSPYAPWFVVDTFML